MSDTRAKYIANVKRLIEEKDDVALISIIKQSNPDDRLVTIREISKQNYLTDEISEYLFNKMLEDLDLAFAEEMKACFPKDYAEFKKNDPETFKNFFKYAEKIQLITDKGQRTTCIEFMKQFIFGYGRIRYDGGNLTLATKRKTHGNFLPTIIKSDEDDSYFEAIRKMGYPLRERFIYASTHWICGDIKIDEKGKASILLIDSLGDNELAEDPNSSRLSVQILSRFKLIFPSADFFLIGTKRQKTGKGCSVYALDDVMHLYSVEKYLNEKYAGDLFNYLKQNPVQEIQSEGMKIHLSHLPAHMLRTMTSRKLIDSLSNMEDGHLPLNKKGDTAQSLGKTPTAPNFFSNQLHDGKEKLSNMRLEYKLSKMATANFNFLLTHDQNAIKEEMNKHTLQGFKSRVEEHLKLTSNSKKF